MIFRGNSDSGCLRCSGGLCFFHVCIWALWRLNRTYTAPGPATQTPLLQSLCGHGSQISAGLCTNRERERKRESTEPCRGYGGEESCSNAKENISVANHIKMVMHYSLENNIYDAHAMAAYQLHSI